MLHSSPKSWTPAGQVPDCLVENRVNYSCERAELSMFETFEQAFSVPLQFENPVLVSMVTGKKVMHFDDESPFGFVPDETLILPPRTAMKIDFPEANMESPTRCIALSLSQELINETIFLVNKNMPVYQNWKMESQPTNILKNKALQQSIHTLIETFLSHNSAKDVLFDLQLKQLIILILQTEARATLLRDYRQQTSSHPFAHVSQYIHNNLHENITVEQLSKKACMSVPTFFRTFKNQFGMTPVEFILKCRIKKAQQMLTTANYTVSEVAYQCGFSSPNYFIRTFKKLTGQTPKTFSSSGKLFTA